MTMMTMMMQRVRETRQRNYRYIREMIRIAFCLGVNFLSPTPLRNRLILLNVLTVAVTLSGAYGTYGLMRDDGMPSALKLEGFCLALQILIALAKMMFFWTSQRRFQRLLEKALTHETLLGSGLFENEHASQHPASDGVQANDAMRALTDANIAMAMKEQTDRIMASIWQNVRFQVLWYIINCGAICSNYLLSAIIENQYHYFVGTPNYRPKMPYPSTFEVWKDKGMTFPYYHIQMFVTCVVIWSSGAGAISFDGMFIVLSLHAVGLLKSLKSIIMLSSSPELEASQKAKYLRACCKLYQKIYDYASEVEQLYRHVSLSQFLLILIILGIVMFQLSVGLESDIKTVIRMLMYLSAAGYQIFIYCYNGQRITTASEEIPFALYSIDWTGESREFRQMLCMLQMRTNRSLSISISWFSTMSLTTLLSVANKSGSYFLLLRNLSN